MNYQLQINSVEPIPGYNAKAAFCVDSSSVFREENEISPIQLDDHHSIIPWGADNQMPYNMCLSFVFQTKGK